MAKPKTPEKPQRKIDQATKTVAAILQEFGRQAFDVSDRSESALQKMCERWIAHLLQGDASPNRADLADSWLDWPGVRDFVAAERTREKNYVVKNINEYQDLALTLLTDFSEAVQSEQESDGEFRDRLIDLRENAKVKSGDELKAAVFSTISDLNAVLESKKSRHETQLKTLATQVVSLQSELAQVRESAERDGLTQLYNRASFDAHVAETIRRFEKEEIDHVLFMGDIDHFKSLNDAHGHPFGDAVIQGVAKCMGKVFGRKGDFVARYGGEEFAVICPGKLGEEKACGDQLLKAIRALRFEKDGQQVSVTISIGCSGLKKTESAKSWIERADKALYASKELGRNRLTISGS